MQTHPPPTPFRNISWSTAGREEPKRNSSLRGDNLTPSETPKTRRLDCGWKAHTAIPGHFYFLSGWTPQAGAQGQGWVGAGGDEKEPGLALSCESEGRAPLSTTTVAAADGLLLPSPHFSWGTVTPNHSDLGASSSAEKAAITAEERYGPGHPLLKFWFCDLQAT